MAQHRHPHAERFRLRIDALLVMATRLDQPDKRKVYFPDMYGLIIDILASDPRPSVELCRHLHSVQAGLSRLFESKRAEFALVEDIRAALHGARELVEEPPLGHR